MTNMAATTPSNVPFKRKRHGNSMTSKLHEYTDEETGEVLRIETTKQAKRRHQKSGGAQWRPTKGQINAADIWNKQEEKIKRDKEREERKKRNAARQAEKEAEQRRMQEELLRKGKITVEDTWAKVSASQVRLNKFFCLPQSKQHTGSEIITEASRTENTSAKAIVNRNPKDFVGGIDRDKVEKSVVHESPVKIDEDFGDYFTNSPLTQRSPANNCLEKPELKIEENIAEPRGLMPPPPRRHPRSAQSTLLAGQSPTLILSNLSPNRIALAELSPAQLNTLAIRYQSPEVLRSKLAQSPSQHKSPFLSTQIVSETLAGLSSQDFEDDFQIDKENRPPCSWQSCKEKPNNTSCIDSPIITSKSCPPVVVSTGFGEIDEFSYDEFDDDLDDETLLSIAATQKLKKDFWMAAQNNVLAWDAKPTATPPANLTNYATEVTSAVENPTSKTSDSFTFTDIDDDELLKVVEDFETDTENLSDEDFLQCMESFEAKQEPARKKRRTKPWDVFPIDMKS